MPPICSPLQGTLTPFLYPLFFSSAARTGSRTLFNTLHKRDESTTASVPASAEQSEQPEPTFEEGSHLNPPPTDYSRTIFSDKATVKLYAGGGGHGCISFLREKYISAGPANGGDGGTGGNVYIQATRGETSLHKLARRRNIKAGRGKNGQGRTRNGERGDDVIIQVPVGTVIREVERMDPVFEAEQKQKLEDALQLEASKEAIKEASIEVSKEASNEASDEDSKEPDKVVSNEVSKKTSKKGPWKWNRDKWLLYPAVTPEDIATAEFPSLPKARRSPLASSQAIAPISLDLSRPMERPILLTAGAVGGMGNPHFVTKEVPRPKYATRGDEGMQVVLELELKLLADVGFVGLPNAGKSTLLRAMSKSRARVGNWAFTTLQPNIGTVVLDDNRGRPEEQSRLPNGEPRTNYTIADIPGLVQDAHLDRGLGVSFLRHVERARVLAFVIDLSAGNAVQALQALWKEVGEYERMKIQEEQDNSPPMVQWSPFQTVQDAIRNQPETIIMNTGPSFEAPLKPAIPSIAGKPWFVVATKADLPDTKENFAELRAYLEKVGKGEVEHPSGQKRVWEQAVSAVPVSAINGHGTKQITTLVVNLLEHGDV